MQTVDKKTNKAYSVKTQKALISDIDLSRRTVTGFFSTINYFDSDREVLISGVYDNSISKRGVNSTAIAKFKHLFNHEFSKVLSATVSLSQKKVGDTEGLFFESKIARTTLGDDILIGYNEGIYDNHSIGFRYVREKTMYIDTTSAEWNKFVSMLVNPDEALKGGYMFVLSDIDLFEGSTVAFGANLLTPFLGIKSENKQNVLFNVKNRIERLSNHLRKSKQSDAILSRFEIELLQLQQIISDYTSEIEPKKQKQTEKKLNIEYIIKNLK
jgi:HK97 family phage prohead protease